MKLLLDTHAALWWWSNSDSLTTPVRQALADPANQIYFSAASGYEIIQKHRLGRLELPAQISGSLSSVVAAEQWHALPLSLKECTWAAALSHSHRDPFDRMLAAQAKLGSYVLASVDPFFRDLEIELLW